MKNGKTPDPNVMHPVAGYDKEIYVKPTVKNPNIIVGDFTCIALSALLKPEKWMARKSLPY